jgi:L-ascorbate metabolism protein UlaG (beta-lactamase superfamily)
MSLLQRAVRVGTTYQNPVPTQVGGLSTVFKVLPLFLRNREQRVPVRRPGPFVTDPETYLREPASGLRVTWFGHSCLLVEIDGLRVLIDPVWDERAAPVAWAGPRRFFAPTLPLELLPELDVILISHDHYDHLGQGTVEALSGLGCALKARWVTSLGVGAHLEKWGVDRARITELDWTESTVVSCGRTGCELTLTAVPTRHFSGRRFKRNGTLWSSFVLRGGTHTVYFGADSGFWDGFAEIGAKYGPFDLTMLEIGAFHPLWASIHLGPEGAAKAFAALGGEGLLMPIHWGLFDLALHGWREPIERMTELATAEGIDLWSPLPGLPTEVVAGETLRSTWWQAD